MPENRNLPPETPPNFDLTLLSNFVHQVVNPLNGVAGTLDNLADGVIVGEGRREQRLNAARAQLEQCITLIRNLAFLAQGSGGVAEQDRRIVVLPQVIIETAMFFQEDGKSKKIEVSLKDRVIQNRVRGHPELIRQVLMNIFDNCIKYGKFGTEIVVNQWIQNDTRYAVIKIEGISKYPVTQEDLNRICELGYRGDNAKKIVASGTGLGLYICKKIIDDHNGEFHIQSKGSDGIEFTIKLPYGERGDGR
ncbi:MAG TPA: HAMP domain-containing sensor histidine kinase [Allosphingosinicella sp.]|nr:HAMP domain-containing sensor histidine kinase [Allosphingosinicella sp.]